MRIQRIKDMRIDKDLNQTEVAKAINCAQTCYSKYELGQRDIPTITLIKLADLFETSIDYLLGRTDDPTPPRKSKHNLSS